MLGREMLSKGKQIIDIAIGDVIEYKEARSGSIANNKLSITMRLNTYLLAPHAEHQPQTLINQTPMMAPVQQNILNDEITSLPTEAHLLNFKNFDVYCTQAERIPMLCKKLVGSERPIFGLVNEGTGKACDVDEFDDYYQHLFIWDNDAQRLVGAYRLGLSDQIMSKKGVKGLYSRTLFRYDKKLIEQFGHAIEMGRSVIDLPYQRSLTALLLLWKGIATICLPQPTLHPFVWPGKH